MLNRIKKDKTLYVDYVGGLFVFVHGFCNGIEVKRTSRRQKGSELVKRLVVLEQCKECKKKCKIKSSANAKLVCCSDYEKQGQKEEKKG